MTNDKSADILTTINTQFRELIELINEQRTDSALNKFRQFETFLHRRTPNLFQRRKWWLISAAVLLLSVFIAYVQSTDQFLYDIYFVCLSVFRMLIIKILPLWDWTRVYTSPCLIGNPFFSNKMDLSECDKCVNITSIQRQSNITFFNFTKTIYLNHLPVIIDDATQSWPAMKKLDVDTLFELYAEDPVLSEHDLCHFESNIRQYHRVGGADRLFHDYLKGTRRSFVIHWNNCKRETLKVIRALYSKPYFLPPSLGQTLLGNWFLVSVGAEKSSAYLHPIPGSSDWHWLAQIEGRSVITLQPQSPCDLECSAMKSVKLYPGDMIIYSHLYNASYTPLSKETILLLQGFE